MALRIKSSWHDSDRNDANDKGLEDNAGALAFIAWRIALDKAKTLHGEDYVYRSDGQRIATICEFLGFELAMIDRMVFERLSFAQRELFINTLGRRIGDHVQDNASDLFGEGDFKTGFIETLNERLADYSEFGFGDGGPSYSFYHFIGRKVQGILGEDQTNKWSIDQVMDIDAPNVYKDTKKAVDDLFFGVSMDTEG